MLLNRLGKLNPPRRRSVELAGVLLLAVGLVGKVCPTDAATTSGTATGHRSLDATTRNTISTAVKSTDSPSQRYFDAIAPEDRENFIKYHLDKALEQRIPNYKSSTPNDFEFTTFQDAVEPEDFSVNLLDHFMSAFGLSEVHVFEFVALNVICFPSGWCFNPDDVGNICCPF